MYLVYSKNPIESCPFCVNAVELLKEKHLPYEVYKVGTHFTRDWLRDAYPEMKTYPVILERTIVENNKAIYKLVGGYTELKAKIDG